MENYDKKEKLIDYDELDIYSDEGGFSDVLTDAVSEATVAQSDILSQLQKMQKTLKEQITALSSTISDLSEKHENDLNRCQPKPLRPTSDEKHEEEILKLRQKNIKERRNGNKN